MCQHSVLLEKSHIIKSLAISPLKTYSVPIKHINITMRTFSNDRFTGRRNSGGFGGRRSEKPTMYDAVCDRCGKDCQVPFRPSGNKPVYCSNCFEKEGNGDSRGSRSFGRSERRNDFGRSSDRKMFSAVCDNCGKDCEVPFKPSSDKPIYCSKCFEDLAPKRDDRNDRPRERSGGNDNGLLKAQLEGINEKLDRLIYLLAPKEKVEKKAVKPEEKKEPKTKKVAVKKKATTKVLKKEILPPL